MRALHRPGLPICGHKDCEIPFDDIVDVEAVAAVIKRAEDEVFSLLETNWPLVKRVTNALCRRDRITSIEFDALVAGSESAGSESNGKRPSLRRSSRPKRKPGPRHGGPNTRRAIASKDDGSSNDDGSSQHEQAEVPSALAS
jgi:hypothetical protein